MHKNIWEITVVVFFFFYGYSNFTDFFHIESHTMKFVLLFFVQLMKIVSHGLMWYYIYIYSHNFHWWSCGTVPQIIAEITVVISFTCREAILHVQRQDAVEKNKNKKVQTSCSECWIYFNPAFLFFDEEHAAHQELLETKSLFPLVQNDDIVLSLAALRTVV